VRSNDSDSSVNNRASDYLRILEFNQQSNYLNFGLYHLSAIGNMFAIEQSGLDASHRFLDCKRRKANQAELKK